MAKRYSIELDEMVPVTQEDWDSAMRHIARQRESAARWHANHPDMIALKAKFEKRRNG